jgi:hypothetical protein
VTRIGLALLRAYVGLFAFFAPAREHALREHSLIEGGLRESYGRYRSEGVARTPAAFATLWEHLGELQPVALLRKTRADAACTQERDPGYRLRVAGGLGAVVLAGAAAFGLLVLQGGEQALPNVTVAQAFAEGDPEANGAVPILGTFETMQEAIYAISGGTVCLPSDLEPGALTDELITTPSTSEQLKACEDFEVPDQFLSDDDAETDETP